MNVPPVVVVLGTGGTIAARSGPDGLVPATVVEEIVGDAVALRGGDVPLIRARALMSIDSSAMTPDNTRTIVDAVAASLVDPAVVGVVVLHGTDTLEESTIAVDLVHADPRPVVFTGAQRPADAPDADGPGNLADAIDCAADPRSRDRGVLVCFGGTVLPARTTTKIDTVDPVAFACAHPGLPRPLLDAAGSAPTHTRAEASARVDIVATWPGMAADVVGSAIANGAVGIVVAGVGSANVPPPVAAAVAAALDAGVIVVVTSRVPDGPVAATYGGDGGAIALQTSGAVISRWLRATQARVVLAALLDRGATHADVVEFFALSEPADPDPVAPPTTAG